jgi:hypothetical protein
MRRADRRIGLGAVLALTATPALAAAHGNEGAESRQGSRDTNAQTRQVDEHFTRSVADNCTYEGSLQGNIEKLPGRGTLGAALYNPQVTLRGTVRCPDGYQRSLGAQAIRGTRLSGADLERRAEMRGRITLDGNGRVCTITPDFSMRDGRLVADESFRHSCEAARGGGPRSSPSHRDQGY